MEQTEQYLETWLHKSC